MPIMAKSNDEYTEVKAIKTPDGTEIDYVLSKVDNTYKRTYTATRELEDTPPLEFKSIKPNANLTDYRIYGQTVDGESVGDLVTSGDHAGKYKVPVTVEGKNLWSGVVEQGGVLIDGTYAGSTKRVRFKNVPIEPGSYTISANLTIRLVYAYNGNDRIGRCVNTLEDRPSWTFTVPAGANNISIGLMKYVDGVEVDITPSDFIWGQIEKGSEATTYEPYCTPVTTQIYLPEQIKKVGDEAEYIDYAEQKMHRIGADDIDVTLPALPTLTGTNVLSVGTEVQPSDMYIKGNFKMIAGGGE